MAVKSVVIVLMARYGIQLINGQLQKSQIQELVEEANGVIKDKLSKRIKRTKNSN